MSICTRAVVAVMVGGLCVGLGPLVGPGLARGEQPASGTAPASAPAKDPAPAQSGVPGAAGAKVPPAPGRYEARADGEEIANFPYQRYFTTDRFGRLVTFYLSKPRGAGGKRPLVACVQGSGSQSVFLEVDTPKGKRIASGGPEAAVLKLAGERVRVLVVEKPGVKFLEQPARPGGAEEGSEEFRREHTLERWAEAVGAAIRAAGTLEGIDPSRVMVLGHSEGGLVACRVAAENPAVTHIASLAGGGPTQLFDLVTLARRGAFGDPGATPQQRAAAIESQWAEVVKTPDAHDRFFMGHPHRRWSTFCASSPIAELDKTSAKLFIAQGSADRAVAVEGFDVLRAHLMARGREAVMLRVEDADHGFQKTGDADPRAGWSSIHQQAIEWFLDGSK